MNSTLTAALIDSLAKTPWGSVPEREGEKYAKVAIEVGPNVDKVRNALIGHGLHANAATNFAASMVQAMVEHTRSQETS